MSLMILPGSSANLNSVSNLCTSVRSEPLRESEKESVNPLMRYVLVRNEDFTRGRRELFERPALALTVCEYGCNAAMSHSSCVCGFKRENGRGRTLTFQREVRHVRPKSLREIYEIRKRV